MKISRVCKETLRNAFEDYHHDRRKYLQVVQAEKDNRARRVMKLKESSKKMLIQKHCQEANKTIENLHRVAQATSKHHQQVQKKQQQRIKNSLLVLERVRPKHDENTKTTASRINNEEALKRQTLMNLSLLQRSMVRLNQAEERRKESIEQRSASLSERNLMSARNSKEKSIDLTLGKYQNYVSSMTRKLQKSQRKLKELVDVAKQLTSARIKAEQNRSFHVENKRKDIEQRILEQKQKMLQKSLAKIDNVTKNKQNTLNGISARMRQIRQSKDADIKNSKFELTKQFNAFARRLLQKDYDKQTFLTTVRQQKESLVKEHMYESHQYNIFR